jgi:hypothetical protein
VACRGPLSRRQVRRLRQGARQGLVDDGPRRRRRAPRSCVRGGRVHTRRASGAGRGQGEGGEGARGQGRANAEVPARGLAARQPRRRRQDRRAGPRGAAVLALPACWRGLRAGEAQHALRRRDGARQDRRGPGRRQRRRVSAKRADRVPREPQAELATRVRALARARVRSRCRRQDVPRGRRHRHHQLRPAAQVGARAAPRVGRPDRRRVPLRQEPRSAAVQAAVRARGASEALLDGYAHPEPTGRAVPDRQPPRPSHVPQVLGLRAALLCAHPDELRVGRLGRLEPGRAARPLAQHYHDSAHESGRPHRAAAQAEAGDRSGRRGRREARRCRA